ncbi:MAG: hypothetical protein ACI311_00115 [Bacilli bacterium]
MKKKLCTIGLASLVLFSQTGCSIKEQNTMKDSIFALEGDSNYGIITKYTYTCGTYRYDFELSLVSQLKEKGVPVNDMVERNISYKYGLNRRMYYTLQYNETSYVVGYYDLATDGDIVYHYVNEPAYDIYVYQVNEDYAVYIAYEGVIDESTEFYILNRSTGDFFTDSDYEKYLDENNVNRDLGSYFEYTENGIKYNLITNKKGAHITSESGDFKLTIDYEYILERSEELQVIDSIVGKKKKKITYNFYSTNNELFIYIQSKNSIFGRGWLCPVYFKYNIEHDKFSYIGATDFYTFSFIEKYV